MLSVALALVAACGSSRSGGVQGKAGAGGSSAGSPTSSGMAGATSGSGGNAGADVGGRSTGAAGAGAGAGGMAGAVSSAGSSRGGAPPEPAAGGAPQGGAGTGGASTGGNAPNSGQGGDTGAAGKGGSAGSPELEVGTASVDLVVTVGEKTNHVTQCDTSPTARDSTLTAPFANGARAGSLVCVPEREGGVDVFQFYIVALTTALGEHDASELVYDCTGPDGCVGVGVVAAFVNTSVVSSSEATAKSGTFTLDELSESGRMSGSLDLTLSTPSIEVRMQGTFAANLLDCTTFPSETCPE